MNVMSESACLVEIVKCIINSSADINKVKVTDWGNIISLAKRHGIIQYVYRYMQQLDESNKPSSEIVLYLENLSALEIRQAILRGHAVSTLQSGLESEGIDHMLIKGSVTQKRYPDPYLRSMGDIDFLYKPEQHGALCEALGKLGFELKSAGRVHDLYLNNNIVVEAHRQLMPSSSSYFSFCDNLWDRVVKLDSFEHAYSMRIEDEFVFNFIHLASHFKKGGIGIRFIVDVWIYKRLQMDWKYINNKLSELKLEKFYDIISSLVEKWFGKTDDPTPIVAEIERYVFSGGVFGNSENQKNAAIRNGKIRYFFKACFPNYKEMQSMFPWLKCRLLLPVAWLCRFFGGFTKRRRNVKILLQPVKITDKDSVAEIKEFFVNCGLE